MLYVCKSCFKRVFCKSDICLGRYICSFVLNSDCGLIYKCTTDSVIHLLGSGHSSLLFLGQLHIFLEIRV
jgi:hypothetical protein